MGIAKLLARGEPFGGGYFQFTIQKPRNLTCFFSNQCDLSSSSAVDYESKVGHNFKPKINSNRILLEIVRYCL